MLMIPFAENIRVRTEYFKNYYTSRMGTVFRLRNIIIINCKTMFFSVLLENKNKKYF